MHAQFQETRVYTLESFYETQWRYLPLGIVDPFWPLQTGFQLARTSPYHYLKRLFDVFASATALVICSPLFVLVPLFIWMNDGCSGLIQTGTSRPRRKTFHSFQIPDHATVVEIIRTKIFTRAKAIPE